MAANGWDDQAFARRTVDRDRAFARAQRSEPLRTTDGPGEG
jgi:hypothetical protein